MWTERPWERVAMVASILLNIFLGGIIAGEVFTGGKGPAAHPGQVVAGLIRVAQLPQPERKKFAAVMHEYRGAIATKRLDAKKEREAVKEAVTAPVYDPAAVAAAFAKLRQANEATQETIQIAVTEAMKTLSPESRRTLAEP